MPEKAAPVQKGVSFPVDSKGGRSTSKAGQAAIAAALRGCGTAKGEEYAAKCEKEKNWRFGYNKHFMNLVKASADSPAAALGASQAGADFMHENFMFFKAGDTENSTPFSDYMSSRAKVPEFSRGTYGGDGSKPGPLEVPYKKGVLTGKALQARLTKWAEYGTIEADAAKSLGAMCDGILDLSIEKTGQAYVLIGAGSAMGPLTKLLKHGATVVCIDIPGAWGAGPQAMWKRIFDQAANSPGNVIYPYNGAGGNAASALPDEKTYADKMKQVGFNLTEQPKEVLVWLNAVRKDLGVPLVVGNYTYLDSDMHVKLSIAADAVIKGLCEADNKTKIAFLCTPTDIHVITDAAHKEAGKNYGWHAGRGVEAFFNIISFGKALKCNFLKPLPAADGSNIKIVDGLSVAQGPNYALAKRLQHWRAMLAYENGHTVSSNIAPSTATASVVSNKTFEWAYGGMPYFKPYEIFQQQTTNAVMGGMLAYDTTSKDSAADPKNRKKYSIVNTMELFKHNSVHGGVWRAGYTVDSIGEVSVLIHFMGGPKVFLKLVYFLIIIVGLLVAKYGFGITIGV